MQRLRDFARREVVLVVAIVLAAASCIAVPPDAAYSAYIDWHTLALLFCLMAVVAGLRSLGVLDSMGKWLVSRAKSQRAIAFALVGIVFFASMAVTNDVALITFVPLALVTLRAAGMEGRALLVAALMTVAANLGSMLTPVGNPQNLYLFTASGMSVSRFLSLMAPTRDFPQPFWVGAFSCCSGRSLVAGKRLARTRAAFGVLLMGKKSSRGRAGPMAPHMSSRMGLARMPPLRPCGDAAAGVLQFTWCCSASVCSQLRESSTCA